MVSTLRTDYFGAGVFRVLDARKRNHVQVPLVGTSAIIAYQFYFQVIAPRLVDITILPAVLGMIGGVDGLLKGLPFGVFGCGERHGKCVGQDVG